MLRQIPVGRTRPNDPELIDVIVAFPATWTVSWVAWFEEERLLFGFGPGGES